MVFLGSRCLLYLPPCISASTSSTCCRGELSGPSSFTVACLPLTFQDDVSHCERFPLGPIVLIDELSANDIPHPERCPASIFCISGPTSLSANCSFLRDCPSQPLAAAATTVHNLEPSARLPIGSGSTLRGTVAWKWRLSLCV
jgi:hypothetical protein